MSIVANIVQEFHNINMTEIKDGSVDNIDIFEEGMPSNLQKFADGGPVDNIDIFAYGGELTP